MNKKILTLLASMSLAFFMSACGDDNSSSAGVDCLDNENCLDDDISSDSDDAKSSSSVKKDDKSSSSKKDEKSSSSTKDESSSSVKDDSSSSVNSSSSAKDDKSSSSEKKDDESSSSEKKDEKSSSSEKVESSSSEAESSSSEEPESSSSVELKITYLSETPNAADLEVSGDTLFAVFQRSYTGEDFNVHFDDNGLLALYKLSDGTLLDTITLATKNPQAVKMVKGSLYVGTTGGTYNSSWGTDADEERGIEKVDLKNKKSELWVSGTQLGAGVYMMEADPKKGKIYVVINKGYDAEFNANMPVMEVDVATKAVKSVGDVSDGSGTLFVDATTGKLYIGDRGFMHGDPFEMGKMNVRVYDGTKLTSLFEDYDMDTYEGFMYQPAGVSVIDDEVFIYISDFSSGKLYWVEDDDICDGDDAIQFSGDTKIVTVDGELYVLDRKGSGSISKVNTSAKSVAWQKAINAENPYDIVAIDGSTAWVAMYNTAEIRKISLADGSTISSIDTKELSAKKYEPVE
ncbi:MAG: hypothetical protein II850_05690 [Fibrobacter sp.]|nr:hypothetical protein [Fibrobacter sp.]